MLKYVKILEGYTFFYLPWHGYVKIRWFKDLKWGASGNQTWLAGKAHIILSLMPFDDFPSYESDLYRISMDFPIFSCYFSIPIEDLPAYHGPGAWTCGHDARAHAFSTDEAISHINAGLRRRSLYQKVSSLVFNGVTRILLGLNRI